MCVSTRSIEADAVVRLCNPDPRSPVRFLKLVEQRSVACDYIQRLYNSMYVECISATAATR